MDSYIESYEIMDNILGRGAFGHVKDAKFKKDRNLKICVKILNKEYSFGKIEATPLQVAELNMCKWMKSMRHENLVQIYDVYDSILNDPMAYIFMEKCELNLHQLKENTKKQGGKLSKEKLLDIIKQIVKGYLYLISQNIMHRDLKPENILCNINNNDLIIKIADFGLSRTFTAQKDEKLTNKVGTPYYRAPEISETQNTSERIIYDNRCDIFSLGVIIFELALLEKQFNSKEIRKLINNTFSNLYKDIIKDKIDQEIITLLDKMIVYDPTQRITWQQLGEYFQISPQLQSAPFIINVQQQQIAPICAQFNNTIQNQKQTSPIIQKQNSNQQQFAAQEYTKPICISGNKMLQKQNSLDTNYQSVEFENKNFGTINNQQKQQNNFQQQAQQNNIFPIAKPQAQLEQGVNSQQMQLGLKVQQQQPIIQTNSLQKIKFYTIIQPSQFHNQAKDDQSGEQKQRKLSTCINNNATQFNNNATQFNNNATQFNNNATQFNNNATYINNNATYINNNANYINNNATQCNNNAGQFQNPQTFKNPSQNQNYSQIPQFQITNAQNQRMVMTKQIGN
ncbi:unnamed protein product [Paramecium octaurelia]|uniref:non-specific serine/threonine protein kinase n=1 Tax=Paramecium octaurelia TaxID=43137 RepID=A0A8S1S4H1_PAROT|nr:unnamed protein product [Paramecium octaurelia]